MKYAEKVRRKDQMYGPGCCAHMDGKTRYTPEQLDAHKRRVAQARKKYRDDFDVQRHVMK